MASGDADYLENKILDHVLGGPDYTRPATVYVALTTTDPTDAAAGTEVSGNGYSRLAVTNNSTNFPGASGGAKSNGVAFNFATPTPAGWGTILGVEIWDAASGGNRLKWGELAADKLVNAGDPVSFPAGDLDFTHD